MALAARAAFLMVFAAVVVSEPGVAEDRISVMKCCRKDEKLMPDAGDEIGRCVPSETPWVPFVYFPAQQAMIPKLPSNWQIQEATRPSCRDAVLTYIPYRHTNPFIFFDNGQVILDGGVGEQIRPGKFCADSNALLACLPRTVRNPAAATMKPRVYRCCGDNAEFDERKNTCVNAKERPDALPLLPNSSYVELVPGFPPCTRSDNFTIVGSTDEASLRSDGSLWVDGIGLPAGQYCVERVTDQDIAKVFACAEHAPHRPQVQAADIRFTLYPVGFIISVVFLAATLAAGWLLPAAHHVLHWRCQTHHVACLMLGDLLMAIIQLAGDSLQGGACKAIAIMAHFFFLAAFFWLNTMCFNIWWTFRDLRPASLEKGQETVRLRVYACYAWGGPLLVAGLAALLDHLPSEPGYTFYRPRFGDRQCWFYGDMEILTYFFGPVGALLAVNLLLFAATARELTCGLWKREVVKSTTERAALGRVCMKLVVVMGVTWVADVVSWAVGGPRYLWYFTDLINALQGVFIFAVVGCQPQVWAALKRLCNRNPRANASRQGNALSTTSHGMPSMGDSVTQNPSTKTAPLETIC